MGTLIVRYLSCDVPGCMDDYDEIERGETFAQFVAHSGWQRVGGKYICPDCAHDGKRP